tara:strand:+ start:1891 stop:3156 length:1266 start_codon:yes stop_codon:yes gene_type:complete
MGSEEAGLNANAPRHHVAYTMSRFPKVTETFVLYELLEMERAGLEISVFPLLRQRGGVRHPEVDRIADRVHHRGLVAPTVLWANLATAVRHPIRYVQALALGISSVWRSRRFLLGAIAFFPKAVWIARSMQRAGVDHVHAHFASHAAWAAMVGNRLTGIPYSFTAHGSDIHVDQTGFAAKAARAAFVVTVSQYNRQFLSERCGAAATERMHIVHCGVDVDEFTPATPPVTGPLRILCVASLRKVKGHRFLIAACELLRQRGVEFRCDLVGDGPTRPEVERLLADADLTDSFAMHGALARPAVRELLRSSHVAVLASVIDEAGRREGIPVSLMEAMATGLPVVASDLSGIPELIAHEQHGLLVPPGAPVDLADALQRLGSDAALRSRLGTAGRLRVMRDFDLRENARTLANLVRSSLAIPMS